MWHRQFSTMCHWFLRATIMLQPIHTQTRASERAHAHFRAFTNNQINYANAVADDLHQPIYLICLTHIKCMHKLCRNSILSSISRELHAPDVHSANHAWWQIRLGNWIKLMVIIIVALPIHSLSFTRSIESSVNESCFFNEQCEAFNFQTECRDGKCICRFEMSPIVNKDGTIECKGNFTIFNPDEAAYTLYNSQM